MKSVLIRSFLIRIQSKRGKIRTRKTPNTDTSHAVPIKSPKNTSGVLLGDSIFAGFLRYSNIWYKFLDENILNGSIDNEMIQNVLWRVENIPLPQLLEYFLINCGTNNLDTDNSGK